jgi:hypothetical protein
MTSTEKGKETGRQNWAKERKRNSAGDRSGRSTEHGGFLKRFRKRYSDVRKSFKAYKERQVNQGKREPKELLAASTDEDQQASGDGVLKHGPSGTSVIKGGQICEVDGQRVGKSESGMFQIMDERSRYNGMLVPDYFEKVVRPWLLASVKLHRERHKAILRGESSNKAIPRAPWPEKPEEEVT